MQVADTSDSMFEKMGTGDFDVVSASGDSSLRMIYAGKVAPGEHRPVHALPRGPPRVPAPAGLELRRRRPVRHAARVGAQLMAYRSDVVTPAPTSWDVVFDPSSPPYSGKITDYDSPTDGIAAAAVYLMSTQPDLGIENPYALDQDQFDAAVELLKAQQPHVGSYWASYTDAQKALENGSTVVGSTWQIIVNLAQADAAPVASVLPPDEGATGWADTWMVDAKSPHPNCAYEWINWVTSPEVQAQVAEWFGEAPRQRQGVRADHRADALRHVPRGRRGLLLEDLVLDDAAVHVPRRPHGREVRAVRRVGGQGVERGQERVTAW